MNKKLNLTKTNSYLNKKGMKISCLMTFLLPFTSFAGSENPRSDTLARPYSGIAASSPSLSYRVESKKISITTDSQTRYEGPTKASDTLWSIADRYLPDDAKVNVYQAVGAIYRLNPNAFKDNNIHGLIPGSFLVLPTMAQIEQEKTSKIAIQLRLDRIAKLEKERQEKENLAAKLQKQTQLAKSEPVKITDSTLDELSSNDTMPSKNTSSPLLALTNALEKNASLSEKGSGTQIDSVKTGVNDYQAAINAQTVLANSTQGMPILTFETVSTSEAESGLSLNESASKSQIDMLILQEKLANSNLEVTRLTENNQLLSHRLMMMEKELMAFKQYIESDEDAKQEIQEFIEIQRQFNALLNADNQFSLDKLVANPFALTILVAIFAAITLALIIFFFTRRLKKGKKAAVKEMPFFTASAINTPEFAASDTSSSSPILSCDDSQKMKMPDPINLFEQIEKTQKKLAKESRKIKETKLETGNEKCLDITQGVEQVSEIKSASNLEKDLPEEIKITPAFKEALNEEQKQTLRILFEDKGEITKNPEKESGLIESPIKTDKELIDLKQQPDKPKDKAGTDYVVGFDENEVIDLNEMAEFNEEDALQAVLAENALSRADDLVLNDDNHSNLDKKTIPLSIVVDLDELTTEPPKASVSSPNEVSMSVKTDDYQAVLNTLDFSHKESDFNLQMDLAKAYIEMQDFDGAVELLEQVLKSRDPHLQQQAKEMLITLK